MGVTWSQFFPPPPTLTEVNLPSQNGKVFIVTGGSSGVGFELCRILYRVGGTVYLAGRSEEKALDAIAKIKRLCTPTSAEGNIEGNIIFLPLSLHDLTTIKPAVKIFTTAESRLDVLFNNAGVSNPPGGTSPQGHDLQLATNCLGPHLFTQLLLPILRRTAETSSISSVRVIWTASIVVDAFALETGIELAELLQKGADKSRYYFNTKVGNWFLAHSLASQIGTDGILSLVQNPGNIKTNIMRHSQAYVRFILGPLLYGPRFGAYTAIWSAFTGDLKIEDGGKYILPWGRIHPCPRDDLLRAMKGKEEGGTGVAAAFIQYCDKQIVAFL
ncbi:Short-chain dehydrogenase/reductase SDR [Penicillium robsamsonii]|uniref:Short-chain dehydrogenase/reductase SDR n=1 Tax=Penicillium robsamsonii TaxID=1792511 RepID=UPI0025467734|nr:Short-chain dehydrogenase/reductase SDR [Penicillium robsamsonii]KAJ5835441.1 Short-chain dehydrogenase/reductase SDR [Penicillium robsamsonii]